MTELRKQPFQGQSIPPAAVQEAPQMGRRIVYSVGFLMLTLLVFWEPFRTLISLSSRYDYYSQIVLVPFAAAGLICLKRNKIFSHPQFSLALGGSLLLTGLLCYWFGRTHWLQWNESDNLALALFSAILLVWAGFTLVYGSRAFRAAAFPMVFLFLMIPIPVLWLDKLIYVLQKGSAELTYTLLRLVNVPVFRQEFIFSLPGVNIEVAKECSGIHSSLALFITSLVTGYLFLRPGWRRVLLTLSFLPIVIFTNSLRIAALSLLSVYVDRSFLTGNLHKNGGIVFFLLALGLLILVLTPLRGAIGGSPAPKQQPAA